ncbi:MAG: hypothetical protein JO190_07285 [Candidatus Eremiobacteraeota bacterium]|nr:hypothetical protein [Candidatus Eremiobacteraeota bacterium]MBV8497689.1 hypothetical protein [Candidatus Eremiobacteraeota bacterium]
MTFNRLFGAVAFATVLAGVALAFSFLGTPAHQRLISLDDVRVWHLQRTASQLHDRYPNGGLPARLPEDLALKDPTTEQTFEYHRVDAERYVICAVFATNESSDRGQVYPAGAQWVARDWKHGAGRACYELDVTASPPAAPR